MITCFTEHVLKGLGCLGRIVDMYVFVSFQLTGIGLLFKISLKQ